MSSPASPSEPADALQPARRDDAASESELEPRQLIRRSDAVLRAGIMMLGAGTSSLRVRELMRRSAAALGLDSLRASIGFTDITLTVQRGGIFRTQVAEITTPGVNAHRIAMLQGLSSGMAERTTTSALDSELDRIEKTPLLYPLWLLTLMVGMACASVTVLTGGGWREVVAVLPASALSFWLLRLMGRFQVNHLAAVMIAASSACGLFVGFTAILDAALGDASPWSAIGLICASIFLIPGFPLVTGGLDLTRVDLTAGIPRVAYAAMVLLAIAIGVWVVAALAGISPELASSGPAASWFVWVVRVIASFAAVFGWALMFNSPLAAAVASGTVAVIANVPRLIMLDAGVAGHIATFVACVIVGLACALVGHWFGLEKIIMTVPTMLVMIPGSSALQTLLHFDRTDIMMGVTSGVSTLLVVIAMVAGLGAARMLTDPEWTYTRPDAPSLVNVLTKGARKLPLRRKR